MFPQLIDFQGFWGYPSVRRWTRFPQGFVTVRPESKGAQGGERPMTTFEERQKGFERKFALDEELKFKATARRNRLLGLWAAGEMGIAGDAAQAYAREVVKADLAEPGEEDVFRKLRADFDAKGVNQSDHQIRRMMAEMMSQAIAQIESEAKE
jgi:hypothetical protein